MKITQLDIQGFRSLKNVSWKPGDLNVLIGPNGSGKSNLLRMLEMISAAAQGRLSRYVQAQGGMAALVWDGQAERVLFRVVAQESNDPSGDFPLAYEAMLSPLGRRSTHRVEQETLGNPKTGRPDFIRTGRSVEVFGVDEAGQRRSRSLKDEQIDLEELTLPFIVGPLSENYDIDTLQRYLASWSIYHDVRTDQEAILRQPAISRQESQTSPDGQNLINVLHTAYSGDREFKREVNSAMRVAFGDDFEELVFAPDAGDQRVQLRVRWKTLKRDQSAADLSDGTLRFLFLLAVLASPNPAPLIAIDEPETGLHPSMLPLVAEFAVDAALRTQVILTTHSDQFLDAFRVTDTRPTTTVAKWQDGETILTTLADDELSYWLKDYTLGSLYRSGELENMAS